MKRILGLDLGVNSIGWSVVNEMEGLDEVSSIVAAGVRVVPLSPDEKTAFEKGKAIETNAERRLKRGARRNLQRFKLRREELRKILIENGFIGPDDVLSEDGNFSTFETYRLRAKAVTEEVSLKDFARILLMINKKRGYKSSRKAKNDADGTAISGMDLAIEMYENGLTPAQICQRLYGEGKNKMPDFYRSDLLAEFDRIWDKQKKFYPEILTDELRDSVKDRSPRAVYAILSKAFEWTENEKRWNSEKAESEIVATKRTIQGVRRKSKGRELAVEICNLRCDGLVNRLNPEDFVAVLQDIASQLEKSSGYLGKISDRSKQLYVNKLTVGQLLWDSIKRDSSASLKNIVFYRQDYLDEFNTIWETQAKYHKELTPKLKQEIRDVVIFYQRPLKSQKGLVSICELEQREMVVEKNGKKVTKVVGRKVIPRSHPLYQEFRIWQSLNNVEVMLSEISGRRKRKRMADAASLFDGNADELEISGRRELFLEEKRLLAEELMVKPHLTKTQILDLLFPGRKGLDLNVDKVIGNETVHTLYKSYSAMIEAYGGYSEVDFKLPAADINRYLTKIFDSVGWDTGLLYKTGFADLAEMEKSSLYGLWHLLYSFEGDKTTTGNGNLIEKIAMRYNIEPMCASILANTVFPGDYGSLCAKAINKIMPFLKEGNHYDEACVYAGYRHSRRSLTKEEIEARQLKGALEILPKNSLRNPVVEKILNQMVNVVNSVAAEYGRHDGNDGPFDEIRVELARDLKKNAKERAEATKAIKDNDAENQKIREIIKKEFGIDHVSRNDVIRYKLYQELEMNGYKTLYSNTYIPREKIFSKEIDIEHIIPQACLFDDSLSNKTLEYRHINIEKGKLTAYDFVSQKYSAEELAQYEERCRTLFKDKKAKLRKLLMTADEIPDGFIDRDLRNTQYISRKALEMLGDICRSVVATTGSITDELRSEWQLVDVLKEINLPKYENMGMVEVYRDDDGRVIKSIKDWTKRNDHRHHAMDAITVAFTRRVFIQYYNYKNAQWNEKDSQHSNIIAIRKKYFNGDRALPPMPLAKLRSEVKKALESILVSIKAKNKVVTLNTNKIRTRAGVKQVVQSTPRGALHKEFVYGVRKRYVSKYESVGSGFDENKIMTVADKRYREALLKRFREFGEDPKKAFTGKNSLEKNPVYLEGSTSACVPQKVKTVTLEEYRTIRKPVNKDLPVEYVVDAAVKKMLKQRLAEFGNDPGKAFVNLDENPIIFCGKALRSVVIDARVDTGMYIHDKRDKEGNFMLDESGNRMKVGYVKSDANHHVAIFRRPKLDKKGNPKFDAEGRREYEWEERIVNFMEAVCRANDSQPVVDRTWGRDEGWEFVFTLKKDEFFVFPDKAKGFDPSAIDLTDPANAAVISPNLFRAQKLSSGDYYFRHHLETKVEDVAALKNITWKRIQKISNLEGVVKVRVDHIGRIVDVGEY